MANQGSGFCIGCGAGLEPGHRYCWRCGCARWQAADDEAGPEASPSAPDVTRPPPVAGTPAFQEVQQAARPPRLGLLPWFYGAGAVVFLVNLTQGLAYFLSPTQRSLMMTELGERGIPAGQQPALLTAYGVILLGGAAIAVILHAAAFYGLRRRRRWGWLSAVVVAAFWSLLIVGIPVLVRLVHRDVRRAFGVD